MTRKFNAFWQLRQSKLSAVVSHSDNSNSLVRFVRPVRVVQAKAQF